MTSSREEFAKTNEARDRAMGIGVVDDPYPRYHELREQCPVHHGTLTGAFVRAASWQKAMTAAAPDMSCFIAPLFSADLSEMPPLSKVIPLPTMTTWARPAAVWRPSSAGT